MKGNLLLVDDDREMCEMLERFMVREGYTVKYATSAPQALACVDQNTFDLVITDIKMPGTNGIELCRQIAAKTPTTPVILLTAFGTLETAVDAIRAGAYDFVTKPVDLT